MNAPKSLTNHENVKKFSLFKSTEISPLVKKTVDLSPVHRRASSTHVYVKEKETPKKQYSELNKVEMMKDFGKRIDKNAFYDNNLNLYEQYLKNFIGNTADELIKENEQKQSFIKSPSKSVKPTIIKPRKHGSVITKSLFPDKAFISNLELNDEDLQS